MNKILVTCYVDPDLDGTAGAVAYAEYLQCKGQEVLAAVMGEPHDEAKFIFAKFNFPYPQNVKDDRDFEEVILVDASDTKGLEGNIDPQKVVEIIDHRKIHEAHLFPNAKTQIEMVGAAATLVAEKFYNEKISISKMSATLLYSAIVSNTLNFKASVTTERDVEMAVWLKVEAGLDDNFWKELFLAKSNLSGDKLSMRMRGEVAYFDIADKKIGIVQVEIVNVGELIKNRESEIISNLEKLKEEYNLDFIFQTTVDLENDRNVFVAEDKDLQKILEQVLGVKFVGSVAERKGLILRKQIVPLLKEAK